MRLSDKALTKKLDKAVTELLHKITTKKECFVCHRQSDWFHPKDNPYGLQTGHYISRSVYLLRWDMKNIEAVCSSCNRTHEENTLPHTKAILDKYGVQRIEYLNQRWQEGKQKAKSFTRSEKIELLEAIRLLIDS